jgi:alpha-1,3/alpha-1,6-mannosyltransferase
MALAGWLLQYNRDTYDVLFIDQLSACIPFLKWFSSSRVLFYCHFPDKLLAKRGSWLREMYRQVFDKLEELSTGKESLSSRLNPN